MLQVKFSQLKPISTLPRKYNEYVKQAEKEGAVFFMKKSKPQAVLVDFKFWEKIDKIVQKFENAEALAAIAEAEADIKAGRVYQAKSMKDLCQVKL